MITSIIKRDGRVAAFNDSKIASAIEKAFSATNSICGKEEARRLTKQVCERLDELVKERAPTVEEIQDAVEAELIKNGHVRTAKAYILYRAERSRVREMNTRLMRTFEDITVKSASESDIKRENANINGDTAMGVMLKYGSEGAKEFNSIFILKPEHSKAHLEGDIHIHDMDFLTLTTTCCQIDLKKLFKGGFCTGHGVLREPSGISSYSALACIAVQSNQNDQHGGQSVVNFDYALAMGVAKTYRKLYASNLAKTLELLAGLEEPAERVKAVASKLAGRELYPAIDISEEYLKAEADEYSEIEKSLMDRCQQFARKKAFEETDRETFQAMEALIHNLNTMHSRAGAQTPFSSVNYGMDMSPEGRMVTKNVLLAHEKGLGNGETPIFPIHIFRVKEGVNYNPEDPSYDLFKLAMRVSAKRLFPNFSFQDAPFNIKYYKGTPETEIAYMGCRTRVMANNFDLSREVSPGRGNLSFSSINLPRIAINANKNISWFFEELDRKIDLCIDQILERFEIQARKKVRNFPFLFGQGIWIDSETLGPDDEVRELLKHGTLSVGFIGLAETLKCLIGEHHGESVAAQNLGHDIVSHMRDRMDAACKKYNLNFSLLATPAEGLSGRFLRLDKRKFGIIEGVTDREYYTNSFHVPVYHKINAFEKIKIEAPYHELTNAGHITYVELDGDPTQNLEAFETIIRAMHDAGIGYGSINHPIDFDPSCGFTGIIGDMCPSCGREEGEYRFDRIRRITGYLVGTVDRFNNAKRAEERDRLKHSIKVK